MPLYDTRKTPGSADPEAGTLVLIGGALDEDPQILQRIISLAAEARDAHDQNAPPRIAIFTTASDPAESAADAASTTAENDEADGRYYVELFARHGALGIPIPVGIAADPLWPGASYHRGAATSEQVAETVQSCDAIFFGGGDQTHYVLALFRSEDPQQQPFGARHDTAVMRAVREVLERGGVVAGTSAGLAVQQAAPMVSGGGSAEAWTRGATAGHADDDLLRYIPAGGLGFFPEGLLDSHFNEWGRVARAVRLAQATNERLAIGVDEHTALVYSRRDRLGEVLGTGGVSTLDLTEAAFAAGANGPGVVGVRWSHFTAGDRYDFRNATSIRSTEVHVEPGSGAAPQTVGDVWGSEHGLALLHLAQRLVASPQRIATGESAAVAGTQFRVTLHRDERTTWTEPGGFAELGLSITPIPSAG